MSGETRTISNTYNGDIVIPEGDTLIVAGILNGGIQVSKCAHLVISGVMNGGILSSSTSTIEVSGTLDAPSIVVNGSFVISGIVNTSSDLSAARILPGAIVSGQKY